MTPRIHLSLLVFLVSVTEAIPLRTSADNPSGVGAAAASESAKQFKLAEGLEISMFAAEPFVRNPTDMDIDERGRVWITEGVNYRSSFQPWGVLEAGGDRIVILEDSDGDGVADKETVFYQDPSINAALGICVLGNKVIVSDSPNVFLLTDTDGDGRADKRELLFTGIGGKDHDHGVHAFLFGPDGKLYFNMGNEGKQLYRPLQREIPLHGVIGQVDMAPVVDLDGNIVNNTGKPYRNGMVFRCNLDGSDVETLAWNFRNNYEVAVDSFGTLWQSDNDDDGNRGVRINYVMEFGNYGFSHELTGASWQAGWERARAMGVSEDLKVYYEWHQFDPGVVPNLLHTGAGSPTGILVYEGKLLPQEYRNQILHCDAGPRMVRSYPTERDGAGFKAGIREIVSTADTWFRPSDLCVAPDGSVFVADWNDAGVGGHYMADRKLETMTGRIYRVSAKGHKLSFPKLDLKTTAGCVDALKSPNLSTRYLGWTKLHELGTGAEEALRGMWHDPDSRIRARSLHLLARMPGKAEQYVAEAVKDNDSDIRITGIRIARELGLDTTPFLRKLVEDKSAQVRRECAIALRHHKSTEAPALWARLASQYDGKDRWYLEALGIGADRQWDSFLQAWLGNGEKQRTSPVGREIIWRSRARETPQMLKSIILDPILSAREREHYFHAFDFLVGEERQAALIELTGGGQGNEQTNQIAWEALRRLQGSDLGATPALRQAVAGMLKLVRGTPRFVEVVRDFNLSDEDSELLDYCERNPNEPSASEAMRFLLTHHDNKILDVALTGPKAMELVELLGKTGERRATAILEPLLSNTNREMKIRKQAVREMARVQGGARTLLNLAREDKLPADLKLTAAFELNGLVQPELRNQAAQLLPLPQSRTAESLPPIEKLAKLTGDPTKGAKVFNREEVGCFKCHQIRGQGTDFGPNLSEIGTKLGKDAMYEAILDPSAGISFGYEAWKVELKNGEEAYGLIVSETADDLAVKATGGVITHYRKADVAGRTQQKLSIMPAGLERTMSRDDIVDLIEYLTTLRK